MKKVYFYALRDPRDNGIKYIGRTVNPKNRLRQHIYSGKSNGSKDRKSAWIKSLLNKNLKPLMEIIDYIDGYENIDNIKNKEMQLIERYRKICDLKNDKDLVENGYQFSEECRKKMSNAQIGNTNKKGKKLTEESRIKIANIPLGRRKINNGVNEKFVQESELQSFLEDGWKLGRLPLSKEHKEKLKEAWKNRNPDSEETRERKRLGAIKGWKTKKQK